MPWRSLRHCLALCCVGWLVMPADGRAATAAIVCDPPAVTGQSFAMICSFAHQSMPLTLVMRGTVEDESIAKPTEIAVLAAGKPRQTLSVESDGVLLDALQKESLEAIDLDFDGADDLKVLTATSAGPNGAYAYWLYRPATGTFEPRHDLDDKLSGFDVAVDPHTKTISVSGRASCCAWDIDTFHWANDRLAQLSHEESGSLDLGDALSDVAGIQAFRATSPTLCATRTSLYDASGRITREVIKTEGDPCDEADDYRKSTQGIDRTLNGTQRHGAVTDLYRDGILIQRTVVYDPPKAP